mmetsp:Transcript_16526/g.35056  ORF Transcript_16526/g.35056 Transcript_16526/m.35056 type:complete len:356 (+) Transcript_16526:374-1441(+)
MQRAMMRVGDFEVNLDRLLGSGGFGSVFHAKEIIDGVPQEVAAKRVTCNDESTRALVRKEVALMELCGTHENIIQMRGFLEVNNLAWIFLELATGGELFDRLIDSGSLSERAARPYAKGLASALAHCHDKGVVHRDVKLENAMLCAHDAHALKLLDFGLAVQVPLSERGGFEEEKFFDGVGSRSYKAPEMWSASAGYLAPPVDAWALGVTLFSLTSGFFPFDKAAQDDWRFVNFAQQVSSGVSACDALFGTYKRPCPYSPELKELLDSLLSLDPHNRPSMRAVQAHSWLAPADAPSAAADSAEFAPFDDSAELHASEEVLYRCIEPENAKTAKSESAADLPPEAMRVQRQCAERE